MSYIAAGGLSDEQTEALLDIDPKDLRTLSVDRRVELALQHAEYEARKKEAFWTALQSFATAAIPIAAFFGLTALFGKK